MALAEVAKLLVGPVSGLGHAVSSVIAWKLGDRPRVSLHHVPSEAMPSSGD